MHLTVEQCWNGHHAVSSCIQQWMFRTQTIFHQYPDFHLPMYFGISCWNYVVAGIVMIYTAPPPWFVLLRQSRYRFPYYTFIFLLIFIQSPLSFLADYVYMDQDSIFHVVDRLIAVPLMTLELWKVVCLWIWGWSCHGKNICTTGRSHGTWSSQYYDGYHHTTVIVLYTFGTIMAIACFLSSQQSQSQQDIDGFILWHNRWHLYPLYASVITLYDHSIQQLHHPLQHPEELPATDEPRPLLVSSVPMIHLSAVSSSSSLSSTATSKEKEL